MTVSSGDVRDIVQDDVAYALLKQPPRAPARA